MKESLSTHEAYAAMFAYLEQIYGRTRSDDLGVLLGGMSLLSDGETADPAAWQDWIKAVERATTGNVDTAQKLE